MNEEFNRGYMGRLSNHLLPQMIYNAIILTKSRMRKKPQWRLNQLNEYHK